MQNKSFESVITLCLTKIAPTLANCSFDKDELNEATEKRGLDYSSMELTKRVPKVIPETKWEMVHNTFRHERFVVLKRKIIRWSSEDNNREETAAKD